MVKYKEYFNQMVSNNQELFDRFRQIQAEYQKNPDLWENEFNRQGEKILEIIRDWENRLCSKSETSGYARYSANLADKFWSEVRKLFPLIDRVGISKQNFTIKKINLN